MAAHGNINSKDLETLIAKIPKFSGSLNPLESSEVRRYQFNRWRKGVIKVMNLRGYGELIPKDELLVVVPDEEEVLIHAEGGGGEEELEEEGTATEGVAAEERKEESSGETEAQQNREYARWRARPLPLSPCLYSHLFQIGLTSLLR